MNERLPGDSKPATTLILLPNLTPQGWWDANSASCEHFHTGHPTKLLHSAPSFIFFSGSDEAVFKLCKLVKCHPGLEKN